MKNATCISMLALGLIAGATFAQPGPGHIGPHHDRMGLRGGPGMERGHAGFERGQRQRDGMRGRLIEEFDVNGDGKLDEQERAAARDARETRQAERMQKMIDEFDVDGDNALNADELSAAMESLHHRRGARGFDGPREGRRGGPGNVPPRVMEKFDVDGNGQLDDDERADLKGAMKGRMEKRHTRMLEQFDTDGDGELSEAEHQAAREARRQRHEAKRSEMIEKFDGDGDGRLTGDERTAAREAMRDGVQQRRLLHRLDTNGNMVLDADEAAAALEAVKAQDADADYNRDGAVDQADMQVIVDLLGDQRS